MAPVCALCFSVPCRVECRLAHPPRLPHAVYRLPPPATWATTLIGHLHSNAANLIAICCTGTPLTLFWLKACA